MNENANKASNQRRPSRSVVNNGRTVHAAHFHFHRNTDTSPRHRRFPALTRHTSRGRRVFNGTARGTLYNEHTQRARARAVKETREMETGAKPVESIPRCTRTYFIMRSENGELRLRFPPTIVYLPSCAAVASNRF